MMKKTRVQVFASALALAAAAAVAFAARAASSAAEDAGGAALKEVAGYKKWTRVTETPFPIESFFSGG